MRTHTGDPTEKVEVAALALTGQLEYAAALGGILGVACYLRVRDLTAQSIWYDEGFSMGVARLDWKGFAQLLIQREANMALYYLLLRAWSWLGGGEFFVRFLSVLLGLATVAVVYEVGKRLFTPAVGLASALLLAVNPYHVHFSQEVRGYALVTLLVSLSWVELLRTTETAGERHWRWYVLWTALAAYAHFYALLVPVAQWVWLGLTQDRRTCRRAFRATRMVAYATLPILLFVLRSRGDTLAWIPRLSFSALRNLTLEFCGGGWAVPLVALACTPALLLLVRRDRKPSGLALVVCWLLVPCALVTLASLYRPMLWPRFLIFCIPALALLGGAGATRLPRPAGVFLLTTIAVVSATAGTWNANVYYHDDWRSATRYVLAHAAPGDGVFFYQMPGRASFDYYRSLEKSPSGGPVVVCPAHGEPYRDLLVPPLAEILPTANMEHPRLWVVFNLHLSPSGPDFGSRAVRGWLRRYYVERSETHFENIDVALFELR